MKTRTGIVEWVAMLTMTGLGAATMAQTPYPNPLLPVDFCFIEDELGNYARTPAEGGTGEMAWFTSMAGVMGLNAAMFNAIACATSDINGTGSLPTPNAMLDTYELALVQELVNNPAAHVSLGTWVSQVQSQFTNNYHQLYTSEMNTMVTTSFSGLWPFITALLSSSGITVPPFTPSTQDVLDVYFPDWMRLLAGYGCLGDTDSLAMAPVYMELLAFCELLTPGSCLANDTHPELLAGFASKLGKNGDADNDGITNFTEYSNVLAQGLPFGTSVSCYVESALNPALNGTTCAPDTTPPTVTINQQSSQADPTNTLPIIFDAVFSEAVTGFAVSDITQSGTAAGVTFTIAALDSFHYAVTATAATGNGTIRPTIAANRCTDLNGNNNTASTSTDNTVTLDRVAPTVTINQRAGQADPTNGMQAYFDVVFSESVTGFNAPDIIQTGTHPSVVFTVATVNASHYTVGATALGFPFPVTSGTIQPVISAGGCTDLAGNPNAASTSTDNSVTVDFDAPTVTINQQAAQADPATSLPVRFDVVFNEAATGFTASDITQTGTATGVVFSVATVDASHYTVSVTAIGSDGTVQPIIAAGCCKDLAGNNNLASTSTDNTVIIDLSPPTAVIALDNPTTTALDAVAFSVDFSEAVAPTFTSDDISLTGTLMGAANVAVSGTDPNYTVTVTLNNGGDDGTIGIAVGTNVTDVMGNPYAGGASELYTILNWSGFTEQPAPAWLYIGDDASLDLSASYGNGTLVYQWHFDDGMGALHVGSNTPSLALTNVTEAERGLYWCEATYAGVPFETNHVLVDVKPHLSVTNPQGAELDAGDSHTFSITATGGYLPLIYTWKKNGVNVTAAPDAPEFTLNNLKTGDSGDYTVEVSDANTDTVTSEEATLTVVSYMPLTNMVSLTLLTMLLGAVAVVRIGIMKRKHSEWHKDTSV